MKFSLLVSLLCAGAAAQAAQAADGQALFAQHCAICHQADASGTVGLAPPLKGAHWQRLGADKNYLPTVLLNGLSGAIKLEGQQSFVGNMPAFASQLDDASLAAIANHLRGLQGAADAGRIEPEAFKQQREQAGSPTATRQRRQQILAGN